VKYQNFPEDKPVGAEDGAVVDVITRYGICVVRGSVIAPDPARTSSMVTAVAVLIDILALV